MLKYTPPRLVVSDNAPAPGLGVPFGFVLGEDSNSWDWSFKLKNNGRAAFTVNSYQSSSTAFSVAAPGFPQTLIPNQGIDITLRFSPTETGFYQDSLSFSITGQDTSTVHTVKVSGGVLFSTDPLVRLKYQQAVASYDSVIAINPNSSAASYYLGIILKILNGTIIIEDDVPQYALGFPFGFVLAGDSTQWQWSFKFKNNSSISVIVDNYESSNQAFSILTPSLPHTIGPFREKRVTVLFSPTIDGLYQDTLSFNITGQDTSTVHTVKVSGGALVTTDPLVRLLYRRAVTAYDSAKAYSPNSQAVHNNLGVLCAILNATEEASSEFNRSYSKATKMNRGSVQAIKKEYQQALPTWSNLLQDIETPSYIKPQLKYNMAWVYDEIDSLELAYQYYSEVTVDSFANTRLIAKAFLGRGVTVFKISRDSTASNLDFRKAIELDPYGAGILAQQNIDAIKTGIPGKPLIKLPQQFVLQQNFPNPFNPETEICYQLPEQTYVKLEIFNLLGQKVRTLLAKNIQAGYHVVSWDGKDDNGLAVVSGVYLYSISTKDFIGVKKMVLLR